MCQGLISRGALQCFITYFRAATLRVSQLVYAFVTLWKASSYKSLGVVSMIGVVLIAASVASGLGLTSLLGISFNAASIQVGLFFFISSCLLQLSGERSHLCLFAPFPHAHARKVE